MILSPHITCCLVGILRCSPRSSASFIASPWQLALHVREGETCGFWRAQSVGKNNWVDWIMENLVMFVSDNRKNIDHEYLDLGALGSWGSLNVWSNWWYGYGSIPINTIFRVMNIHLPAILRFTRGTRFWPIPICLMFVASNLRPPSLRGMASRSGRTRCFDQSGDGFIQGEGGDGRADEGPHLWGVP